jgi:ADP-heptose:LPS heptosyltransferase
MPAQAGIQHVRLCDMRRILVIKHGALGDFVQCFAAFSAIRAHHADAETSLLTTAPYVDLARASPWFDRIVVDARPRFWNLPALRALRRRLTGFDMVYDLQTSQRSTRYFQLIGQPKPLWSGIAPGGSHPHADAARNRLHTRERLAGQLRDAGIEDLPVPDLAWLRGAAKMALPPDFVLLVPGAAAHRPEKKWPHFAALAAQLARPCVVVGGAGEGVPGGLDLTGQTTLPELAAIAARASLAIGNDTGPMHLAAALGVPCVVLFSGASDPALTAPRTPEGGWPTILQAPDLADLPVAQVLAALA